MTAKRDPARMVEGSLGDEELLDALRVARAHTPTAAQLESLALKVSAATAVTAAGASGAGGMAKLQALWAKVGAVKLTLALAIAGGAAYVGLRPSAEREAPPRAIQAPAMRDEGAPAIEVPARAPSAKEAAKGSGEVAAHAAPDVPAPAAEAPRASQPAMSRARATAPQRRLTAERTRVPSPSRPTAQRAPLAAPSQSPAQAPAAEPEPRSEPADPSDEAVKPASELELLHRAQRLIARDPEAALAVIEEHTAAYPRGAFAQERDALAIDALRRLGRRAEWSARARVFLERYPGSPHSERIRSWLQ